MDGASIVGSVHAGRAGRPERILASPRSQRPGQWLNLKLPQVQEQFQAALEGWAFAGPVSQTPSNPSRRTPAQRATNLVDGAVQAEVDVVPAVSLGIARQTQSRGRGSPARLRDAGVCASGGVVNAADPDADADLAGAL